MEKYLKNYKNIFIIVVIAILGFVVYSNVGQATSKNVTPLKEAKLNIEHNATDEDTGFQGAVDSEGWKELTFRGPAGDVLKITGLGKLGKLGLTELFFETVEPENADVSIGEMLSNLPEGNYSIYGGGIENGKNTGKVKGVAWLTHDIPKGPVLVSPAEEAEVPTNVDLLIDWEPVTETLDGNPVTIIAYQVIVEKDAEPHPHMIGKPGSLSMYLPPSETSVRVPKEFFEEEANYKWEVLAIEESGNQTLSSSAFSTE